MWVGPGGLYDPVSNAWRSSSFLYTRNATVVWSGTEVLSWGGISGSSPTNNGWRYNPVTDSMTPISTVGAPDPRYFHGAVWTGSKMVVWGGTETGGPRCF